MIDIKDICDIDCRKNRKTHPQTHINFLERVEDIIYPPAIPKARVLDLACGAGVFGKACMDMGAYQYVGVDYDKEEIKNGSEYYKYYDDVQLIYSRVEDFKILPEFDVIMMNGIIYLFDDPFELVEKAANAGPKYMFIETIVGEESITYDSFKGETYAKIEPNFMDSMIETMGYKNIRRRYHDISKGNHPMHNRFATVYEKVDI